MKTLIESIIGRRGRELMNLPVECENILVPGNVVTIKDGERKTTWDYIVLLKRSCKLLEKLDFVFSKYILLRCKRSNSYGYSYWADVENTFIGPKFPVSERFPQLNIINIKGTIPESEIRSIKTADDLKRIFDVYNLTYETH